MLQLQETMESIHKLLKPDHVTSSLSRVCTEFGLENLAYFGLPKCGSLQSPPRLEVTYQDDWIGHYKDKRYAGIDPVLQQGMTSKNAIDWCQLDRTSENNKQFFGEASEFGIGDNGLTIPIMGQGTPIALVSFTSNSVGSEWRKFLVEHATSLHMVSLSLHEHLWKEEGEPDSNELTARETECLRWAAIGKTAFESSVIVGISERTVRHHLEMSRKKLDAANITHAVVKAINANLLGVNF